VQRPWDNKARDDKKGINAQVSLSANLREDIVSQKSTACKMKQAYGKGRQRTQRINIGDPTPSTPLLIRHFIHSV
jgi:hypothetical protein